MLTSYNEQQSSKTDFGAIGPSDNWRRPATGTEDAKGESEGDSKSKASSSPYKTIPFSASPVRSAATLSQR